MKKIHAPSKMYILRHYALYLKISGEILSIFQFYAFENDLIAKRLCGKEVRVEVWLNESVKLRRVIHHLLS